MRKALLFIGLTLPLVACLALSAPLAALRATPTLSPSSTTVPTLSPTLRPSPTARPTQTPTEFPSATLEPALSLTPTVLFGSPSPTPTLPSRLACKLIWQSPGNYISYRPNQAFTVGWKVMNNGTDSWEVGSVYFTYLRGAKMYDYALVQLVTSVAPGQEVILSVHMRAPRDLTMYTTTWSLRQGDTFFCPLKLSIYVVV
jgi:hypothetical protein